MNITMLNLGAQRFRPLSRYARLGWLCVLVLCGAAAVTAKPAAASLPNIVILLADDLGYGDLGCYGHPRIKTPALDKLAREGLRLTSYYSGAPVCSPSRAALLTGVIPQRLGIGDWIREGSKVFLPQNALTIAQLLRRANYATAMVGKWHLSGKLDGSQPTPGDHGFQHWFATANNALPTHENPTNFWRNGQPASPAGQPLNGYSSTLIVEEAINWLIQRRPDQPFLLYAAFHAPHERIATADRFVKAYADIKNPDEAQYFGNVTQLDFEIGRLLKTLDQLQMAQNTIVFFSSDNGPETLNRYAGATRSFGTPGQVNSKKLRGMKLHLSEGGLRVPGLVRWPGVIKAGRVSDEPVSGLDWLPTVADLLRIRLQEPPWDGESVANVLYGERFTRERPIYWQYDFALHEPKDTLKARFAARLGDFKLLVSPDFKNVALYNLKLDPAETTDVSRTELLRIRNMIEPIRLIHRQIEALQYTPKN